VIGHARLLAAATVLAAGCHTPARTALTTQVVFFDDVPFEVGRPAGLKPGTPLDFPVAVNSGPLPLEPGRYEWRLTIDGEADDDWRLPFSVRVEEEDGTL